MEITGKIIVVLPPQSGVSQAGNNWKKQEYVLETEIFPLFTKREGIFPIASSSVTILWADFKNSSPSLVNCIRLLFLENTENPSSFSAFLIQTLKFGCDKPRCLAALLIDPHS